MLHMEISVVKTKGMALLARGVPATIFTCIGQCSGLSTEQLSTLTCVVLHLHESAGIA